MESTSPVAQGPAMLYVEDEPETRELIAGVLAAEYPNLSLYTAADGAEGLALYRKHHPEVVITDIRMPVVDGLRMAGEITAIDPETELIAVTAYSDTGFLLGAIEAGFSHYVLKPVQFDRLFAAVGKSINIINLKRDAKEQNERTRQFAAELEKRVEERTRELEAGRTKIEKTNMRLRDLAGELKSARDRYWSLYNWSPLGYMSLDENFIIREINITGARILGSKRSVLIGSSIEKYLSGDNMALLADNLKKCLDDRQVVTELRITVNEKKHLFVQLHCVPYRIHGNETRLFRTAIIDITRLKEAEDKLRRLNRLYSVLSATGNAIVRLTGRNELFAEVCRILIQEGGFSFACIGVPDMGTGEIRPSASTSAGGKDTDECCVCFTNEINDRDSVAASLREKGYYVSNGVLYHGNANRPHSDPCSMASRAAFSFTIAGEEKGAFSVCADEPGFFDEKMIGLLKQMAADISFALESMEKENSRRNAESALLQETREKLDALQELRKSDRILVEQSHFAAMGELISNIAHHWRQPLNVLGLMIQELPAAYDSGDLTAEYLEDTASRAMEEINALSRTIDDFGYYFKSGHGKTAIDAKDVMERAITLVAASLRERHLRLQTVVEGSVTVEGVERELFQVLLNILINARDVFLERKVEAPKITVKMFTEDEKAVITIADNAGGIPEEIVGRVFDPYLTTKGPDRGTGVGLYMAKIIVERNMRGSLRARNTDEGAEFRIEV